MTRYFVTLAIVTDDDNDDPRRYPWDELLAPPEGESDRYVFYVLGVKEDDS